MSKMINLIKPSDSSFSSIINTNMFRHKPADSPGDEIPKRDEEPKEKKESQQTEPSAPVKSEGDSLKELMEKNLKFYLKTKR